MMMTMPMPPYDLRTLHTCSEVQDAKQFFRTLKNLNVAELVAAYNELHDNAPSRQQPGLRWYEENDYFGPQHTGTFPEAKKWHGERHLEMALFNDFATRATVAATSFKALQLLDYQFPLKAKRADKNIGKVDLFAVVDRTQPGVIELKKIRKNSNQTLSADSPLSGLLQGLAYCAIVEANMSAIASESRRRPLPPLDEKPLHLIVMAPCNYWDFFTSDTSYGTWQSDLQQLADGLAEQLNIKIHFIALEGVDDWPNGGEGQKPRLGNRVIVKDVF